MSQRDVERQVLYEIWHVTGRRKIRLKDIMEWSTSEEAVRKNATADEVVIHCPGIGCWAAVPKKVKGE